MEYAIAQNNQNEIIDNIRVEAVVSFAEISDVLNGENIIVTEKFK